MINENNSSNNNNTPTRDALEQSVETLYSKAYRDYRNKNNPVNKSYLEAIQDALIAILGRSKYTTIKNRIVSDYTKNKIR